MAMEKISKNDFKKEYVSGSIPNKDREFYDIDGIKDIYQEGKGFLKLGFLNFLVYLILVQKIG